MLGQCLLLVQVTDLCVSSGPARSEHQGKTRCARDLLGGWAGDARKSLQSLMQVWYPWKRRGKERGCMGWVSDHPACSLPFVSKTLEFAQTHCAASFVFGMRSLQDSSASPANAFFLWLISLEIIKSNIYLRSSDKINQRFLRMQVRCSGIPISFRIFHS